MSFRALRFRRPANHRPKQSHPYDSEFTGREVKLPVNPAKRLVP